MALFDPSPKHIGRDIKPDAEEGSVALVCNLLEGCAVFAPKRQSCNSGYGGRQGDHRDVIAIERFDEGLSHSVGLRASDQIRSTSSH